MRCLCLNLVCYCFWMNMKYKNHVSLPATVCNLEGQIGQPGYKLFQYIALCLYFLFTFLILPTTMLRKLFIILNETRWHSKTELQVGRRQLLHLPHHQTGWSTCKDPALPMAWTHGWPCSYLRQVPSSVHWIPSFLAKLSMLLLKLSHHSLHHQYFLL